MFAYVGSRTTRERNARGDGISVFRVCSQSGKLDLVQVVTDLVNPSFLTLNASADRLYSVHGDISSVSAFAIDPHTGTLSLLNTQDTQGTNPVHLALAPGGQQLVLSNHLGRSLAVLPVMTDGTLGPVSQRIKLDGPCGPHRIEQPHAKPHHNPFSPHGQHVLVPDKGLDRIFSYRFSDGRLSPSHHPFTETRESAGPRHIAFHPDGDYAYCINELDSTVTAYRFNTETGRLCPLQIRSTLPDTYTGNSRAAEIEIDPAGRFLYASNRGHDSISVFLIDSETGLLSWVDCTSSSGRTPRFITLAPHGRHLYALNEDSDQIIVFDVDTSTGRLHLTELSTHAGSPVCMVFSTPRPRVNHTLKPGVISAASRYT